MESSTLARSIRLITLWSVLLFGNAIAGQWKPLCIEGSSCNAPYQVSLGGGANGYSPIDSQAAGPLVTTNGILLNHTPLEYPVLDKNGAPVRHIFQLSTTGSEDFGDRGASVSDANSIQTASGRKLSFGLYGAAAWFTPEDEVKTINWSGRDAFGLNNSRISGPPIIVNNIMYIGIMSGSGLQSTYASTDDGNSWISKSSRTYLGSERYNLLENSEKNALWGIQSEIFDNPGSLWESIDNGSSWQQVDDGSFPAWTVRVVHDPDNTLTSYALTNNGLFVSTNRGVSWQATSMAEPVHGLVFVNRIEPLSRALIVGTDTGIKVSVDEATSWLNMSSGLLEIPHTVTYAHGMLVATSDAGYFTCNTVDCAGPAQILAPEEDRGIVDVIEFYNTNLDHYFITAHQNEIEFIEQGHAGPGWIKTGESFLAWNLGTTVEAANVCRFYGSMQPGPNSHFYSLSTQDCRFLMTLQEKTPATKPRWNFEAYAFSLMPPLEEHEQPCMEGFIPVYRAYNNGFQKGEDSNHRYVTDRDLLLPLIDEGWSDEGVAFCSPAL